MKSYVDILRAREAAMPRFIEVFAGCGGLSAGLQKSGWTPVLLVDNDKNCINTLRANHGDDGCHIVCKSVTDLHLDEYRGNIDLLSGGIPCQAWSQAGKRRGLDDTRGNLFYDFIRLIDECEPKMFLIENVVGLTTHQNGTTLRGLVELMETTKTNGIRYKIHHRILSANDYGVAQKRKRVIMVGVQESLGVVHEFPSPLDYKPVLRDALRDVPSSIGVQYPPAKAAVLQLVPPGGCWVDLPEDIKRKYMGKSYESGGGKRGMARRIAWDEPCLTLTTSPCQKQTERCHPDETRPFTVREYARIQSFPDSYIFTGSMASQYRQIGNAVPVELAYHVGKSLLDAIS